MTARPEPVATAPTPPQESAHAMNSGPHHHECPYSPGDVPDVHPPNTDTPLFTPTRQRRRHQWTPRSPSGPAPSSRDDPHAVQRRDHVGTSGLALDDSCSQRLLPTADGSRHAYRERARMPVATRPSWFTRGVGTCGESRRRGAWACVGRRARVGLPDCGARAYRGGAGHACFEPLRCLGWDTVGLVGGGHVCESCSFMREPRPYA